MDANGLWQRQTRRLISGYGCSLWDTWDRSALDDDLQHREQRTRRRKDSGRWQQSKRKYTEYSYAEGDQVVGCCISLD